MKVVGLINKEEHTEVIFMAKLLLVGNRARELARQANETDYLIDDTINMYRPKTGEK